MIALVTNWDAESEPIKATVNQLIMLGFPFDAWECQTVSSDIPADLSRFDALLIDGERFRECTPEEEKRL